MTINYKVIEASIKPIKQQKTLYKGPSKEKAMEAYEQPQSLPFSHKRMYLGAKRIYAYEL